MAIAAVPEYLGGDFSKSSPGSRFGMYLRLWGINNRTGERLWTTSDVNYRLAGRDRVERPFRDENKNPALREALKLTGADQDAMTALIQRQRDLALPLEQSGQLLRLEALSVAPFATGLGNEHPLENGFAFLNPYGLPYLAGSGVKGVLRQAARELNQGEWGDSQGWDQTAITALFGQQGPEPDADHQRGALRFWDVLPRIKGGALQVEVMTPHQAHYYQQGQSPHESGSPIPIPFITVPPGSGFNFHVQCDLPFLQRLAPAVAAAGQWQRLLEAAFAHAFAWLGFGAKTAVGYGQVKEDPQARRQREEEECKALEAVRRAQSLAALSPQERAIEDALAHKVDPGQTPGVYLAQQLQAGRWEGEMVPVLAALIRDKLKAEKKWKEQSQKPDKDKDYQRTQAVLKFLKP